MHRRFTPRKKHSKTHLPVTIGVIVIIGLSLFLYSKRDAIASWFTPKIEKITSDAEANERLDRLMSSLAGDRISVLELARDYRARVAWIKDARTKKQFEWILMNRLIEIGEWDETLKILPEVISIANTPQLETLAEEAREHGDYELQLKIEDKIQKILSENTSKEDISYLLRSLQRSVDTDLKLQDKNDAIKRITRLDKPHVQARIETQSQAADAAALQLQRAHLSEVKEPVYVQVKSLLKAQNWPPCPATSILLMEEVRTTLSEDANLKPDILRDLAIKMDRCVSSMLGSGNLNKSLPACYMMLGEILHRLGDAPGCAKALSLAAAFAEGFNEMTPETELRIARLRSRALISQNEMEQARDDLKYLAEKDPDASERIRALILLGENSQGEEREKFARLGWAALEAAPAALENRDSSLMAGIASNLAESHKARKEYAEAAGWYAKALKLSQTLYPDLTDGRALSIRCKLGLAQLQAKNDAAAARQFLGVVRDIEAFDKTAREAFDKAEPALYKQAVRELSRAYLFMKERDLAKQVIRKIGEGLPDASR